MKKWCVVGLVLCVMTVIAGCMLGGGNFWHEASHNVAYQFSYHMGHFFLPQFQVKESPSTEKEDVVYLDSAKEESYETFSSAVVENMEESEKESKTMVDESLKDPDVLLSSFYEVDPTTCVPEGMISYEQLLGIDLRIDTSMEGPKVLIYHTHSTEAYCDSVEGKDEDTVIGVGDYLASLLEEKYHIEVLHHMGRYDLDNKENAYKNAARDLPGILEEHPSIQVVIDLHRDGVDDSVKLTTTEDGVKMAQVMFFNGICTDAQGNPMYHLFNENLQGNLAFSFQMQLKAKASYENLVRKIYLRGYRYNMHMAKRSMLLEVGAQTNTVEEAKNAMVPVADLLAEVLLGEN